MTEWTSDSWRAKTARHQPAYPDVEALAEATGELAAMPPLVTSWEIESLKSQLAEAAAGKRFLLQGGDCAESFGECMACIAASFALGDSQGNMPSREAIR
jgi:3-deoxy-7-phosphoheptulonate synthase